jgi:hypothetical protein
MAGLMRVSAAPIRAARLPRPTLAWAGYAAAAWAVLGLPMHVYSGLGGGVEVPLSTAELLWRAGHWAAALALCLVAALALALVEPWGRRAPSWLLIVPSFAVSVVTVAYAADGVLGRIAALAGVAAGLDARGGLSALERGAVDVGAWIGGQYPYAYSLVLGMLVALAGMAYLGGATARRVWLVVLGLGVLRLLLAL